MAPALPPPSSPPGGDSEGSGRAVCLQPSTGTARPPGPPGARSHQLNPGRGGCAPASFCGPRGHGQQQSRDQPGLTALRGRAQPRSAGREPAAGPRQGGRGAAGAMSPEQRPRRARGKRPPPPPCSPGKSPRCGREETHQKRRRGGEQTRRLCGGIGCGPARRGQAAPEPLRRAQRCAGGAGSTPVGIHLFAGTHRIKGLGRAQGLPPPPRLQRCRSLSPARPLPQPLPGAPQPRSALLRQAAALRRARSKRSAELQRPPAGTADRPPAAASGELSCTPPTARPEQSPHPPRPSHHQPQTALAPPSAPRGPWHGNKDHKRPLTRGESAGLSPREHCTIKR